MVAKRNETLTPAQSRHVEQLLHARHVRGDGRIDSPGREALEDQVRGR